MSSQAVGHPHLVSISSVEGNNFFFFYYLIPLSPYQLAMADSFPTFNLIIIVTIKILCNFYIYFSDSRGLASPS